jgi:Type IV secretion system pilin
VRHYFKQLLVGVFLLFGFLLPGSAFAATDLFNNVCEGGAANGSAACRDNKAVQSESEDNPVYGPNGILTRVTNIVTIVVALASVLSIVYAGMKMITSGSNSQEFNSARERIIYACVALVAVAVAQSVVRFVIGKV